MPPERQTVTAWVAILISAAGVCLAIFINLIFLGRYVGRQDAINEKVMEIGKKIDSWNDRCDERMGGIGKEVKRLEIKFAAKTGDASNGG